VLQKLGLAKRSAPGVPADHHRLRRVGALRSGDVQPPGHPAPAGGGVQRSEEPRVAPLPARDVRPRASGQGGDGPQGHCPGGRHGRVRRLRKARRAPLQRRRGLEAGSRPSSICSSVTSGNAACAAGSSRATASRRGGRTRSASTSPPSATRSRGRGSRSRRRRPGGSRGRRGGGRGERL